MDWFIMLTVGLVPLGVSDGAEIVGAVGEPC